MRSIVSAVCLTWCAFGGTGAIGQTTNSVQFPAGYAPGESPCVLQANNLCVPVSSTAPLPVAARQESVALASANTAAGLSTVYGGSYIASQTCTSYNSGTLTIRYRGPDGATMLTLLSKTASDATGGTLVSLGSNAVVDATLPAGSNGCNVTLARVP